MSSGLNNGIDDSNITFELMHQRAKHHRSISQLIINIGNKNKHKTEQSDKAFATDVMAVAKSCVYAKHAFTVHDMS